MRCIELTRDEPDKLICTDLGRVLVANDIDDPVTHIQRDKHRFMAHVRAIPVISWSCCGITVPPSIYLDAAIYLGHRKGCGAQVSVMPQNHAKA